MLPKTPAVFLGARKAPNWLPRDGDTGLRFCGETCRASYVALGGTAYRFAVQPRTLAEAEVANNAELDSPTLPDDPVAVPDWAVPRDLPTSFVAAAVVAAAMLVLALADWPYGYYQLLRVVVCAVAVWGAVLTYGMEKQGWTWLLGALAVLFNPVFPIYLEREVWAFIDVATAVLLIASLRLLSPIRVVPAAEPDFPWWEARDEINRRGPSARALAVGDPKKWAAYLRQLDQASLNKPDADN